MSIQPIISNSPKARFVSGINRLWEFATAPSAAIESAEKRWQAQLLSALLLVLIALAPLSYVLVRRAEGSTADNGSGLSAVVAILSLALLLFAYGLSRTSRYLTAATLTLVVTPLAIFGAIIASPVDNIDRARYLVLSMLICGMIFSLRTTLLVSLSYIASSLVVMAALNVPAPYPLHAVLFMVIGAAVIITFIFYRDRAEADRQRVLAAARDEVSASHELYRTLAANLPQSAVLLFDHELRFLLAEGAALTELGYTKAMLEGSILSEVIAPDALDPRDSGFQAALTGGERVRERLINGQIYRAHYLPVKNDDGMIVAGMLLLQNITEQKRAEAALRENEERYRLMAENSTDLISVQTPAGEFLYASPAARLLLGYDPEEMIGRSTFDFLHPEDSDRFKRVNERTLQSPGVTTLAYRIRRKDGSYTWLESASRVVTNPAGSTQIVTASRDVSERMEANEALRRSEEQFRSLVASMDNLVFAIDLDGHFLVYHPMPSSIYDTPFDTEVFVGKHYRDVLPDALSTKLEEAVQTAMSTLSTQQIDYTLDLDGEERFYSARISPMIGANLQLLGSTVVVSDMSEANQARGRQERLLALEIIQREVGMLFLESDDLNLVIDQVLEIMGAFLDVSRAYMFRLRENERLLDSVHEWCAPGMTPEIQNLQGLAYDELFPSLMPLLVNDGIVAAEQIKELPPDLYRALDALGLQSVLFLPFYVDQRLDGFIGFHETRHARRWLPEEIAAIRTFAQSCARMFERRQAELALIGARDDALRSAKMKSEFVSNMSHEIRTPMTGVIGMLDLMRETKLSDDQKEFVEIAHNSAIRLLGLVGVILDFSKIEAGKVALELIPLDVRGVVTEVQSLLTVQAGKKGLQLTASVADEVPARVLGDPTRLRQILTNLVSNSIKFTEHGTISISAHEISGTYGRTRLRFEVSDTGIGIPADRQVQIFDSFVQADSSTTRRYGGAGLGLAICKQLVALMGGEIDVKSAPGTGSTFGFTLTMPIVALNDRATLNTDFNFVQVMVMDEENSARYLLAEQLRLWGTNVIEASTLDEARSLLQASARREEEVEILLLRSRQALAVQDGFAVELRAALNTQTPFLVQLYDDEALASSTFDLHLRRPVHPSDLYQLMANHASREFDPGTQTINADQSIPPDGWRVLVADDEPMNRQIVVHALEQFGYVVDTARNGQEVLNLLDQQNYRVILMDMQMPVMDGLEATRNIRAREGITSQIPIIAFTASLEREQRQHYFDNGISAVIGKPFSLRELRQTVENWTATP